LLRGLEMSNNYAHALKIWLREDRYTEMIKGTTHNELENTLQEISKSGPVTVVPYREEAKP
jgi:hypothetical protein